MKNVAQISAKEFLALPSEALPGAVFVEEEDALVSDPWEAIRTAARTGESVEAVAGTKVLASSSRWVGMREVVS